MVEPAQAQLWRALDRVLDPELDRSIVRLGFVEAVAVEGSCALVTLRLPTFWCAPNFVFMMPNFVFMMVEDIRRALLEVEGIHTVRIRLLDHFASETIEAAVQDGRSFEEAFPGEAQGSLDELRQFFRRKSYLSRHFALLARCALRVSLLRRSARCGWRTSFRGRGLGGPAGQMGRWRRSNPGRWSPAIWNADRSWALTAARKPP
jgi:metal-sulfur cluster biosynthetic enzyme